MSSLLSGNHRAVRSLVYHLSAELSRLGCNDGRARRHRFPHHHHALGAAVCARIRATMGSLRSTTGCVMAYGRNGCECSWRRHYLFRAVDKKGKSIGSLLCDDEIWSLRRHFSAQLSLMGEFPGLTKSTSTGIRRRFVVCDSSVRKIIAGSRLKCVHADISTTRWSRTIERSNSDALRCSMLGLKSFRSAAITLAGVELAHRIRKGQHSIPLNRQRRRSSLRIAR